MYNYSPPRNTAEASKEKSSKYNKLKKEKHWEWHKGGAAKIVDAF